MCRSIDATRVRAEEVAHLSLILGRYLLISGADTTRVQDAVERFASGLGFQCHLLIQYEALLLTVISDEDGEVRTRIGAHVAAMAVDMSAVRELYEVADDAAAGRLDVASAKARLSAIEPAGGRPIYPGWVVAGAMGLTAASLSRLFGGDAPAFVVTFLAGTAAMLAQRQLRRVGVQPLAATFASALTGALVGGLGTRVLPGAAPELCLIAPGMILVPGVPLINGISDAIHYNISLALARLTSGLLVVAAIALGLFAAAMLTGIAIPATGATPLMPIGQDMAFSALASIGFTFLFNVTGGSRLVWACIICGLCSHSLRTALMHCGLDIASGTLIGSMAAGSLAHLFARRFAAPPATFAFPGVVAIMPGSYAFRAVVASLEIMRLSGSTPPPLLAQTLSLVISTILLTAAIAVGLAIPLSRRLPSAIKAQLPGDSA